MRRTITTAGALGSLALFAACQAPAPAPAPAPEPTPPAAAEPAAAAEAEREPSALDGIYTLEQAERGEEVFQQVCSECHDTEDWTERGFLQRWNEQSVYQFFYQIHNTMPYGAPGSLTRQQYADIVAYIFHLNDLPAGPEELGASDDELDDFWMWWLNGG